ncbi:MAG TPA: putative ABC transporter permease [Candidatus Eisenbacteria bacterium]|nr:putative ABC transporter permease [Candidatus Eisenbacteria bacterium]
MTEKIKNPENTTHELSNVLTLKKLVRSYPLHDLLFYFLIYSVLGWAVETLYTFLNYGVLVHRGFLYSPLCPIYGFGVVFAVLLFEPIKKNKIVLYFGSVILATAIEYLTGALLLAIFNERWWDYSQKFLNLNGHITLLFSLRWGFALMIVILFLHPKIVSLVDKITISKKHKFLMFVYSILLFDIIISIKNHH